MSLENYEITIEDYKREYEKTFKEAFKVRSTHGEIYPVKYPRWARDAFKDLQDYFNRSRLVVVTESISYGHELITHKFHDDMFKHYELSKKLRHGENELIKDIITDFVFRMGDSGTMKKENVRMESEGIYAEIVKIAGELNLEFSSYARICTYYTFSLGDNILDEHDVITPSKTKVILFEKNLKWHLDILERLNNGESTHQELVRFEKGTKS